MLGLEKAETVRVYVGENRYPEWLLPEIARVLRLAGGVEELWERFEFELRGSQGPAARKAPPSGERLEASQPEEADDLCEIARSLIEPLSPGDLVTWVGVDRLPPELDLELWPTVAETLLEALQRGVVFLYLHPGQRPAQPRDRLHELRHLPLWPPGGPFDSADWSSPVATLIRNLSTEVQAPDLRGSTEEDEDPAKLLLDLQVFEIPLGPTFFMQPGQLCISIRHWASASRAYRHAGWCIEERSGASGELSRLQLSRLELSRLELAREKSLWQLVAQAVEVHLPLHREIAFRIRPPEADGSDAVPSSA